MAKFNTGQSFADGDQVTGAKLNNIVGLLDIYSGVIADQASIAATVSTADLLLIADTDAGSSGAANKVTVQKLLNDTLTGGTFTNANISEQLTYGTATGNRTVSTSAVITNGTITTALIPTGTFGTTTSTAATITTGTIPTLTAGTTTSTAGIFTSGTIATLNSTTGTVATLDSTTGTIATLNSTTGTIPTLVATTLVTTGTGTAAAPAIVPTGDTNTGIFFPAADTIAFAEGGTEGMRIDSSGNVGIGTASPRSPLDVNGNIYVAGGNQIQITGSPGTTGLQLFGQDAAESLIGTMSSQSLVLRTNATERLRIDAANGTLTSQPTYDNTAAGSTVVVTSAGLIRRTSSSLKYKKDIENLDSSIVDNAIDGLRPVWYRTKNPEGDDKSTWSHVGLIAEEVDSVEPRLVKYKTVEVSINENGERIETQLENPVPEDVDYARLSVVLLSEVKTQRVKIASLEARLEALEAK
jgi:hypothetical protein